MYKNIFLELAIALGISAIAGMNAVCAAEGFKNAYDKLRNIC